MESIVEVAAQRWVDSGIEHGDMVLIHSDSRRTFYELGKAEGFTPLDLLNSLLRAVGSKGTLLFPLFNFDFTKGVRFDIRNTPSHMGVLSEVARAHPEAVRTGHPIYSFAVLGHEACLFREVNNFSGYGVDSPFGILRALDGKVAVLDLDDQKSMTFYHHIEEMNEVPYRFHKRFDGEYTDAQGRTEKRTYGLFVRRLDLGVVTRVNPMGELLWENGIYHGFRPGNGPGLRWGKAQRIFDFVSNHIKEGRAMGLLYELDMVRDDRPRN